MGVCYIKAVELYEEATSLGPPVPPAVPADYAGANKRGMGATMAGYTTEEDILQRYTKELILRLLDPDLYDHHFIT